MRASLFVIIAGAILVAIAVALFLVASPTKQLNFVVNEALGQLNKSETVTLKPGENVSLVFPNPVILIINSSEHIYIYQSGTSSPVVESNVDNITAIAVAPNVTVYLVNNHTNYVYIKYAAIPIGQSLTNALLATLVSLGLGFIGFIVLVVGFVLFALKK